MKHYYQDSLITIYHGDNRVILPQLLAEMGGGKVKFDLLLTDPPFGVKRDKGFEGFEGFGGFGKPIARRRFEDGNWDQERPQQSELIAAINAAKLSIVWGGNFFADYLPKSTHWIFWDKLQTMPTFGDGELAWTNSPRKSVTKVTVEWNGLIGREESRIHPTQKPLDLMLWCIQKYSEAGATILDTYAGSMTVARAAKDLNRKCVCIERDEKFCEAGARRLQQEAFAL